MIFLANALAWAIGVLTSLLWFVGILFLLTGILPYVVRGYHPVVRSVAAMSAPLLRQPRRLLGRLSRRVDLAPFVLGTLALVVGRVGLEPLYPLALALKPPLVVSSQLTLDVLQGLRLALYLYTFLVILRVLMSWFQAPVAHPLVLALIRVTNPPLKLVSRYMPRRFRAIDWTPLIVLLSLSALNEIGIQTLIDTFAATPRALPLIFDGAVSTGV